MNLKGKFAVAVSVAAGIFATPALATGADAPTVEPTGTAKVVFMSDFGVATVNADGTDRQRLTRKKAFPGSSDGDFDSIPVGSPDGRTILYFHTPGGRTGIRSGLVTMASDGSQKKNVLRTGGKRSLQAAAWAPDGSRIYASLNIYKPKSTVIQIVSLNPDGTDLTVVRSEEIENADGDDSPGGILALDASPDGTELLATVVGSDWAVYRLEVIDIATGQSRTLRNGSNGSWSPDGQRIVFDKNGSTSISIMNADGSGSRELLPAGENAWNAHPDWSPDGRIVFSRTQGDSRFSGSEVWTVTPDGECLSRLTNGSPASETPTWLAVAGASTSPGSCGDRAPNPRVAIKVPKRMHKIKPSVYWLGPTWGGHMLTGTSRIMDGGYFDYETCSYFDPTECPGFASVASDVVCSGYPYIEEFRGLFRFRGALFMRTDAGAVIYSGGSRIVLNTGPRRSSFLSQVKMAKAIRPLGGKAKRRLPAAVFTKRDVRRAQRAVRLWKESRSLEPGAVTPARRDVALGYLDFGRALDRIGPVKTVGCRGFRNDPGTRG